MENFTPQPFTILTAILYEFYDTHHVSRPFSTRIYEHLYSMSLLDPFHNVFHFGQEIMFANLVLHYQSLDVFMGMSSVSLRFGIIVTTA